MKCPIILQIWDKSIYYNCLTNQLINKSTISVLTKVPDIGSELIRVSELTEGQDEETEGFPDVVSEKT
jgi:hypothetical protein